MIEKTGTNPNDSRNRIDERNEPPIDSKDDRRFRSSRGDSVESSSKDSFWDGIRDMFWRRDTSNDFVFGTPLENQLEEELAQRLFRGDSSAMQDPRFASIANDPAKRERVQDRAKKLEVGLLTISALNTSANELFKALINAIRV